MLDEVLLLLLELLPVLEIIAKIDFIHCPEESHLLLVHLPNVVVLDWEDDEAIWVLLEQWLWQNLLSLSLIDSADL